MSYSLMDRESIRKSFHPSKVKILFVGESPPANGGFFYVGSPITHSMRRVFAQACEREFLTNDDFLSFFKAEGCYLDDLSYEPVDQYPRAERRQRINGCVGALAKRMKEYKPEYVIAFLMSIEAPVRQAAQLAGLQAPIHAVPFPGPYHQARFFVELCEILKPIFGPAA